MSYSLSQLDAIGDVDPVAEADVYLAYGRDLQAEEILKEALRTSPERPAVRAKLIEVYAKRRDTKGVEHVAKELLQITQGVGPDWQRAQELGLSVDPTNPLYQSGQASEATLSLAAPAYEMDRTLPMSAMHAASTTASTAAHDLGDHGEIDLDISLPPTPEMMDSADSAAQKSDAFSIRDASTAPSDMSIDFDLPVLPATVAVGQQVVAEVPAQAAVPFDLSTISLDLDDDATVIKAVKPASAPVPEFVASNPVPMDVVNDPMMRKVELAHEFMQIGDVDGAKDLLKEVMTDGQEVSRAKARELLNRLT
jgi:pilus assembly protein FimV